MCIYIDMIGIVTHHFLNICSRVMALDLCRNFVSAQYLENYWTYFHQILYMQSYWQDLAWHCYMSFFGNLYQSYGPFLCQNFVSAQYLENQLVEFHQILYMHLSLQNQACDCYKWFFANLYQSYGPWFTPKFRFRSISWELTDIFSPNFIYAFILTRSSSGLLYVIFHVFVPELWPFIYAKILFPLNILSTNW